jgi:hypothetical protein
MCLAAHVIDHLSLPRAPHLHKTFFPPHNRRPPQPHVSSPVSLSLSFQYIEAPLFGLVFETPSVGCKLLRKRNKPRYTGNNLLYGYSRRKECQWRRSEREGDWVLVSVATFVRDADCALGSSCVGRGALSSPSMYRQGTPRPSNGQNWHENQRQ